MYRSIPLVLIVVVLVLAACGGGAPSGATTGATTSAPAGNADNGKKLFSQSAIGKNNAPGCATCHATEAGKTLVGPSLGHIGTDAATVVTSSDYKGQAKDAAGYIRESIENPNAYVAKGFSPGIMYQNYKQDLATNEIDDLVAYLLTLK
jgi:nitric oxide reductase subunit C